MTSDTSAGSMTIVAATTCQLVGENNFPYKQRFPDGCGFSLLACVREAIFT